MDSILTSIKKMHGISEDYTQFDVDLIMYINSILAVLTQMGVGPDSGFSIHDSSEVWSDWLGNDNDINGVMTYVYLRVRLLFDPPSSSGVIKAYNSMVHELEFRLLVTTREPTIIEDDDSTIIDENDI